MSKLITWGAWGAVVIWTLLCWAALGIIDLASGLATSSTGAITETLPVSESLTRSLIDLADDLGEVFVAVVWIGVSALILGGGALIKRFIAGAQRFDTVTHSQDDVVTLRRKPGQDHWSP